MKHFSIITTFFIFLFFNSQVHGQRSGDIVVPNACSGTDTYLSYFVAQLNRCDELMDISVELHGELMEHIRNQDCTVRTIDVITQTDGLQTITVGYNTETSVSFFNLSSRQESILITLEGKDDRGNTVFSYPIQHSTRKRPETVVSESFMAQIFDMGHLPPNSLAPPTVGPHGDVFTYWCGRRMNMVTLLAFYQDFLGLSEYHICRIIALFEQYNLNYTSHQTVSWTGIYCQILWEMWDDYVDSTSGGDDDDDEEEGECECKVINSSVFVNHSVGENASEQLEDCPEVSITEDHDVWSHEGPLPNTNKEHNWLVTKWAYMGAAKSMYTISHHYEGGDEDRYGISKTLPSSILKSSLTLALKCMEPRNAAISSDCDCEKTVTTAAQYNSSSQGQAGTDGNLISSGNGKVKSCMEDYAFFTRWSREGFALIESGLATNCVECESTDTTNIFTDLGTLASGIEDIAPTILDTNGISLSNIDDIFNGVGSVVDLVDNFLQNLTTCGDFMDTSYVLINTADNFTLSPANDFVTYIVSSRIHSLTDFINDESWSELHVVSNYSLASGLESAGDSTCCNELVGAYSIGHLGAFTESELASVSGDDVNYAGYEFEINDPLKSGSWLEYGGLYQESMVTLEHLQVDVALVFAAITPNFLMDVFGIDCGPGCTTGVDCYYNCGYWGDCHEEGFSGTGLMAAFGNETPIANGDNRAAFQQPENNLNFLPTNQVQVYPNPLGSGNDLVIQIAAEGTYEELFVLNALGQPIYQQDIRSNQRLEIAGEQLQEGINLIVLTRKDGSVYVDRIVKQK